MLDNCKPEDIDYTKPIIIKWWQSNGYYRINKYELVGDVVKYFTLVKFPETFQLGEDEDFKNNATLEHIQDTLYWKLCGLVGNRIDLECILTHKDNKGVLATNLNRHTYD